MSKHLCKHCGGAGQVRCVRCDGTGYLNKKDTCYYCSGKGVTVCPACKGEKYIED